MKKISVFAPALLLSLMICTAAYAATPGTPAGDYFYTDIVTYLWNTPVNSINIGGITLIDAESMSHYGFIAVWHNDERWLEIANIDKTVSFEAENGSLLDMKSGKPGTPAGKYYHTDIKTTLDGKEIISYNIGGRTFVAAEAMRDFGYDVIWDANSRTLSINMEHPPSSWMWQFADGTGTTLNDGFSLEFTNMSKTDDFKFELSKTSGEYSSVGNLILTDKTAALIIYQDVKQYGEFWHIISANRNIVYGERVHQDTSERRSELSKVFRIYANGIELGGELSYSQGNGHTDYIFIYDSPLRLEQLETLLLEVGYKQ